MRFPWTIKKLGILCDISMGATPARHEGRYWGAGYAWLSIADMAQGKNLHTTKESITQEALNERRHRLVKPGTLLMSFKLSIGKLGFARVPMYTNEAIVALPVKDIKELLPDYLYYALQVLDLEKGTDRAVMGNTLNKSKLEEIEIPLPPLAEQRRIAAILDKADAIRRKRQESIRLTEEFLRSVFLEMFGDPVTNPKGWNQAPIKELGSVMTGNTPPREKSEYYGDGIEWIKSDNINTPNHFLTKAKEKLTTAGQKVGRTVPKNSILVTCIAGSPDCIGNVAIADRTVAFNQQINAVTSFEGIDPYFLYVQIIVAKKRIQQESTESMKGMVSKGKFENILFIKPPLTLQERFGKVFNKFHDAFLKNNDALSESNNLYGSLIQKAFRGEFN